jgi:hypothetical protein
LQQRSGGTHPGDQDIWGGYELLSLKKEDFQLETGSYERLKMPQEAKQNMNSHEWVTLRPTILSSCFHIDLMDRTPLRYNW